MKSVSFMDNDTPKDITSPAFDINKSINDLVFDETLKNLHIQIEVDDALEEVVITKDDVVQVGKIFSVSDDYTTIKILVNGKPDSNLKSRTYELKFKRESQPKLSQIVFNGSPLSGFDKDILEYTKGILNSQTNVKISSTSIDQNTQIYYKLNDGEYSEGSSNVERNFDVLDVNKLYIKLVDQTRNTSSEYVITINKISPKIDSYIISDTTSEVLSGNSIADNNYDENNKYTSEELIVNYDIDTIKLILSTKSLTSNITITQNSVSRTYSVGDEHKLSVGQNEILVTVTEDEFTFYYYLNIDRRKMNEITSFNYIIENPANQEYTDAVLTIDHSTTEYTIDALAGDDKISLFGIKGYKGANIEVTNASTGSIERGEDIFVLYDEFGFYIPLEVGQNNIKIKVSPTGSDNFAVKEYSLIVNRPLSTAIESLTLKNEEVDLFNFSNGVYNYLATVGNEVSSITLDVVKESINSGEIKLSYGDNIDIDYTSGPLDIPLLVGANEITFKYLGVDSAESLAYKFVIIRESNDASLKTLSVNGYSILPGFDSDVTSYSVELANEVDSIIVTTEANNSYASVAINGKQVDNSGETISLTDLNTTIKIVVTAESGLEKEYTLVANRKKATPVVIPPVVTPPVVITPPPVGPPVVVPIVVPVVVPVLEDVSTVIEDKSGESTVQVEVSEERIVKDVKDKDVEKIEIIAKSDPKATKVDVSLNLAILNELKKSDKKVEVKFDKATFNVDKELLDSLNLKESLNISYNAVSDYKELKEVIGDDYIKLKSKLFELDIFDGTNKVENISKSIPIILTYDSAKVTNKENLAIYYFDEENKTWEYVGGKLLENGQIQFEARHFSKYAVREVKKTFDDITTHWAKKEIEILASRGITSGVSEKLFAPNQSLTNAEFIVLLTKVIGLEETDENTPYLNVPNDAWYSSYIRSAYKANIIQSTYEMNMDPLAKITREQMAEIVMNAYFYHTNTEPGEFVQLAVQFANDEALVSRQFIKNVRRAYQMKILIGDNNNNFNPTSNAKRAEAAIVIKKLLVLLDLL